MSSTLFNLSTGESMRKVACRLDKPIGAEMQRSVSDTNRHELETVLKQINVLRADNIVLTGQVAALQIELDKASQLAHHDELTGLPNRRLLIDRFNQTTSLASRHDQSVVVLFFDLNKFKDVNDRLGHEVGDKLLQQVAVRMKNAIRAADIACRYGGDEFVVLLTDIIHRKDAEKALRKIRTALSLPYSIDHNSIFMTVSDGMAFYPQDSIIFADLIRLSDSSMLQKKIRRETKAINVKG